MNDLFHKYYKYVANYWPTSLTILRYSKIKNVSVKNAKSEN